VHCPAAPLLQDRTLQQDQHGAWNKAYYMPTSADRAVAAARKWIDSVGAGGPFAAAQQAGSRQGRQPQVVVDVSRQQLLDRYSQHTQHCPHCKAGSKQLEKKAGMAQVAAAVMFVVLCGTAGTVGMPGLLAGGVASVVSVAAVVGMAVCSAVLASAKKWLKQFAFVDFVHADNH
jgi:pheophorbide a oxygenase